VVIYRENWNVYGARKLWHATRRQGLGLGRDQVTRLMGIASLGCVIRVQHHTRTTRREENALPARALGA